MYVCLYVLYNPTTKVTLAWESWAFIMQLWGPFPVIVPFRSGTTWLLEIGLKSIKCLSEA